MVKQNRKSQNVENLGRLTKTSVAVITTSREQLLHDGEQKQNLEDLSLLALEEKYLDPTPCGKISHEVSWLRELGSFELCKNKENKRKIFEEGE